MDWLVVMPVFQHSVTQRNVVEFASGVAEKIEVVSVCSRCGVCGCIKPRPHWRLFAVFGGNYTTFLLPKNPYVALRCVALRNGGKRALVDRLRRLTDVS